MSLSDFASQSPTNLYLSVMKIDTEICQINSTAFEEITTGQVCAIQIMFYAERASVFNCYFISVIKWQQRA